MNRESEKDRAQSDEAELSEEEMKSAQGGLRAGIVEAESSYTIQPGLPEVEKRVKSHGGKKPKRV